MTNVDSATVESFGREWTRFDQSGLSATEAQRHFDSYFSTFPWDDLPAAAVGFDLGCGSGRWAKLVAPRVGHLNCIDASSDALAVAQRNLLGIGNCSFHHATVDQIPFPDGSMDFGYSLGVLHHIPDTEQALRACVSKLKPRAPFLVYLYYALENRPLAYRVTWRASDAVRKIVRALPERPKAVVTSAIAAFVYWPLARASKALEKTGRNVNNVPLSAYKDTSFYTMRTDAYDRFCTPLEQRFTRAQISEMMTRAGLSEIRFREEAPYWCASGIRG
jgi:ubiquinone/menaquinone biosynthesis C-methylase UbiE